jgi:hypothetical protein
MRSLPEALDAAEPALRGEIYAEAGIELTYHPGRSVVAVELAPPMGFSACRRGDLNPHVLADTRPST